MNFRCLGLLATVVLGISACSNAPCDREKAFRDKPRAELTGASAMSEKGLTETPTYDRVQVFKPDGSLQCGKGKKIELDAMEKELKGITVLNRTHKNDGLMRIQLCGAPTGDANVFEIAKKDLAEAIKRGFKQWTSTLR